MGKLIRLERAILILSIASAQTVAGSSVTATQIARPEVISNQKIRLLLDVYLNGTKQNLVTDCFVEKNGELWLKRSDLQKLAIIFPKVKPTVFQGVDYLPLSAFEGSRYEVDEHDLVLYLILPTHSLPQTLIDLSGANWEKIRPTVPGGFINYDFSMQHTNVASQTNSALISELGYFNQYGVGTTDFFIQGGSHCPAQWVRLESVWTIDEPERLITWNIGDSITTNISWSGAVRFGGIQWGTNFNTQPYLVTFPLPAFTGQAVVPSTLSVFVNDALNVTKEIKSGPFTLYDIPVVTGAGTVRVVTNDVLGRQRETIMPYYSSQQLLKKDLLDFSYELGFIRENYGLQSFDYSQLLGVGTYLKGLSNEWTAGYHAELMANQQTLGVASTHLWNHSFIVTSGVALSHNLLGWGGLLQFGIQRQTQVYSYGFQVVPTTTYFADLGFVENQPAPILQLQSFATIGSERWGTFSASYSVVKNRISEIEVYDTDAVQILPNAQLLTLNYSRNVSHNLYIILGSLLDFNQSRNSVGFVSLVWGFKENYSLSSTASFQSGDNQQTVLLNKDLPWGEGYGYHLSVSNGTPDQGEAFYAYQNDYGTYSAQIAKIGGQTNYLGEVAGSLIHFAGYTIPSRVVYNSFALVEVPGFENVCIYNRNTCVGKTNQDGVLLVPNLLPYQKNTVNIDVRDFPLTADIPVIEREGVPYYRSGILMEFPVKRVNNITLKLKRSSHQAVPVGATVYLSGQPEIFPVVDDGYVFMTTDKDGKIEGKARWSQGECRFTMTIYNSASNIINLGDIPCY